MSRTMVLERPEMLADTVPDEATVMVIEAGDPWRGVEPVVRERLDTIDRKELARLSLMTQSFQKAHREEEAVVVITDLSKIIAEAGLAPTVSFLKIVVDGGTKVIATEGDSWSEAVRDTIDPLFETVKRSS